MESDIHELEPILSELELERLILVIEKLYKKNYIINRYNIYNIFKLITLKSTIYENKYFHQYKRLYALRNIITKSSLLILKNNFKKINFKQWNINTKISNRNINSRNNDNNYYKYLMIKKETIMRKVVLTTIMNNINKKFNENKLKNYFFMLFKYYAYLLDKYYIKAITITKAIFNYVRKKLKPYKAKFYSIIDYYLTDEDIIHVYKYILINYINKNYKFLGKNKKDEISLMLKNYNNIIDRDYDNLVKNLLQENSLYILLYKSIFNPFFVNKNILTFFSKWKNIGIDELLLHNFQAKDKLTNNLVFSKIYMCILVIKKRIKFYFEILYNNIYRRQTNGLILVDSYELFSILNFESLYDNYIFNVLKGLYKLQNFRNMNNGRIFNVNNKNRKLISLNIWKNNKIISCDYHKRNIINMINKEINIIKGVYIFDKIYILFYNYKIISLINNLLNKYSNNQYKHYVLLKLKVFIKIIEKSAFNKERKKVIHLLYENFKLSTEEKIIKNQLSFIVKSIENVFRTKYLKYKAYFFQRVINIFKFRKNRYKYRNSKKIKIEDKKLIALNKIMKYFIKNSIKKHFFYSLKNCFNHWSLLTGHIPKSIRETQNTKSYNYMNSEDEEDIISQTQEIKELQKCLKEDQDFHHDLKAKINALNEENAFICEKIFEITQRVEKCEKCSILLRSSNISSNNLKSSYGSGIKSVHGTNNNNNNNNNAKKSRNIPLMPGGNSSGLNFQSGGSEFIPRKPQSSLNAYEEVSDPISDQMDDIDENQNDVNIMVSNPYLTGIKQKIINLKKEKEPIIEKLKQEIKSLYSELNIN